MSIKFTKDSFVQNLAQGKLLVPYLERFDDYDVPWEFRYEPKLKDDAWHPSGDCTPSVEDLYAKAKGLRPEGKHSPSLQKAFMVGHFWHQLLQRVICSMDFCEPAAIERKGLKVWGEDDSWGPTLSAKLPTPRPYHWASGSGDIVPLVLPDGWTGILDIKTMSSGDFKQAKKSGLLPARFADKYECQINIYMDFFDQENGMILGVNKDAPHDFVEFSFSRNVDLINTIYDKWLYVSACLDADEPPDPEADSELVLPFTGPTA